MSDTTIMEGPFTYDRATADKLIKTGAGFLHTVTVAAITATPTAGMFTVYDNTAESGTVIYSEWVFATDVGHTVQINARFNTGLYIGFDATLANAQVSVSFK